MFIANLFENYISESGPQLVVFYPGRFQPFHLGHGEVFQSLQSKFGRDNVYIATSNKTEQPKSPFNFSDKVQLMNAAGIPDDRIIQVTSPYKLPEQQFSPENSIFVVAVGSPDKDRLRPGSFKKDGMPGYYQPFESLAKCQTADKHGYVIIADERKKLIDINGQAVDVSHGTQSRAAWNSVRKDPKGRSQFLLQMYGRDDAELGRILDKIPAAVAEGQIIDHDAFVDVYLKGKHQGQMIQKKVGQRIPNKMVNAFIDKVSTKFGLDPKAFIYGPTKIDEDAAGVGVVKDGNDPRYSMATMGDDNDVDEKTLGKMMKGYRLTERATKLREEIDTLKEKWTAKYKRSINCSNPRGFSQRAHCQGRKKK